MGIDTIRQIDRLDEQVGGRFRLTSLLQRRIQELIRGSPRFADGATPLRTALMEIETGKIEACERPEEPKI
jgi:DNA-directed RNA polymerase subunit K/omega